MLEELHVKNYALIEDITIRFSEGLNALTGETGAGKTILVEALGLLLGERASSSMIRRGSDQCTVTGVFSLSEKAPAKKYCSRIGIADDDCLILRRELAGQGKSRCYINDHPVNLGTLLNMGELLVDFHGQHEHQSLFKISEQRDLLDAIGQLGPLRGTIKRLYEEYMLLLEKKESLNVSEQEKIRRLDLYKFQFDEIENIKLKLNEEEEIESLIPKLKYADKLSNLAAQSYDYLYSAEGSIRDQLLKLQDRLVSINQLVGDFNDSIQQVEGISFTVEEITGKIEDFKASLENDPALLDSLLSRQDKIDRLKKKYGATIPEILDFKNKVKQELDYLESLDEQQDDWEKKIKRLKTELLKKGKELTLLRKKTAQRCSADIQKELKKLGMARAFFSIQVGPHVEQNGEAVITSHGLDTIEFLISANPGEQALPLRQVASGGELSRVMLAIKSAAAQKDRIPTLIFDEIDAGIGGSIGTVVGEKLDALAGTHQIIVITHLPQIASFAESHFHVFKHAQKERTVTHIEKLDSEKRTHEIAAMLGGKKVTQVSLKHAEEMLTRL